MHFSVSLRLDSKQILLHFWSINEISLVSSSPTLAQQQPNPDIGEVSAALSGLVGCIHADPGSSLHQPLEYWVRWLSSEGYCPKTLGAWFLELPNIYDSEITAEQLQTYFSGGLAHGITTGDYLDVLTGSAPRFVEAVQTRIQDLLEDDEQDKQVAGGQGFDPRPAYLASGATLVGIVILCKSGYVKKGFNYTRKKASELWSWATSTANDAKSTLSDDVMRDRLHPMDAVRQVENIAPEVPTVALDVERLEKATMPDIKAAAAKYARKDIELMFSDTKIANSAWYEESKGLIHDTVKIDKATFNELRGTHPGGDFSQTELARRFNSLDLKGIREAYGEPIMENYMRLLSPNSDHMRIIKSTLQTQLQSSYQKVLLDEVTAAKAAARQDTIEVIQTEHAFESDIRAKASAACADVRSEAVTQFNQDMKIAKEASLKAEGQFVDVEKQGIADFEEGFEADIEVL